MKTKQIISTNKHPEMLNFFLFIYKTIMFEYLIEVYILYKEISCFFAHDEK
jgi:hypothetical protein